MTNTQSTKRTMRDTNALVVLSGGQDSVTCLGWALDLYGKVSCITFDYGQRHSAEIEAAMRVVGYFERVYGRHIPHEVLEFPDNVLRGTSPLTDRGVELETYTDHDTMAATIGDRVEKTFVPMRNTLFLTVAANRAVVQGCKVLVTGVCQEDNANYPDCTQTFIQYWREMANESLGLGAMAFDHPDRLLVQTPLMHLSKAETVRLALSLPHTYAALAFSHTAYDGQYPPTGKDHASLLRAHGFWQADRPDPLVLRAVYEGRMPMPDTLNYRDAASFTQAMKDMW